MACYHPLLGYRNVSANPGTGKYGISFSPQNAFQDLPITIPCGQCIGCRLEYARQWAIRCVHESQLHSDNSFITLTYDDEHLFEKRSSKSPRGICKCGAPHAYSLCKCDYQKFMKRLRKKISPQKVRFFQCGDYGDKNYRPHFHACLFGYQFPDLIPSPGQHGSPLYTSQLLQSLWPFGTGIIGFVTYESAAYVARYVIKKKHGLHGKEAYKDRLPPYTTQSRKPGIAAKWFDKYKTELYPEDYVVVGRSKKGRPPRFYDTLAEREILPDFNQAKITRLQKAVEMATDPETSLSRLAVKETVKLSQLKQYDREL